MAVYQPIGFDTESDGSLIDSTLHLFEVVVVVVAVVVVVVVVGFFMAADSLRVAPK